MNELCNSVKSFILKGDPNRNEIEFRFTERGEKFSVSSTTFFRLLSETKLEKSLWNLKNTEQTTVVIGKHKLKVNQMLEKLQINHQLYMK